MLRHRRGVVVFAVVMLVLNVVLSVARLREDPTSVAYWFLAVSQVALWVFLPWSFLRSAERTVRAWEEHDRRRSDLPARDES
ncbi:hypothetical protein [Phycicoccus flavus]|uniref:hypothetical protein n=1 Tax=Phycicoccus flavus TaxID=2502783 RepID=UPI000FEB78E8|nr:hypothetical protein [Phycicoccus flavus]NHA68452.1 hypothetical protein [Phycicoccus flavus]